MLCSKGGKRNIMWHNPYARDAFRSRVKIVKSVFPHEPRVLFLVTVLVFIIPARTAHENSAPTRTWHIRQNLGHVIIRILILFGHSAVFSTLGPKTSILLETEQGKFSFAHQLFYRQ